MTWWYSDKLHETSKVDKHINGVTKLTNTCDAVKLIQAVTIRIPQSTQSSPYPKEVNTIPHTLSPSDHKERMLALTQRHHCMLYRLAIHWW